MTRRIGSVEEVRGLVGTVLGPTSSVLVDQHRIDAFAAATGDHQWIHVDPVRAESGPFGGTVAHGYLTLSLVPVFAAELYTLDFGSARVNYGLEKVRFPSPVPAGESLRATAEFVSVEEKDRGVVVRTRFVLSAEGSARPACIAEYVVLVVP